MALNAMFWKWKEFNFGITEEDTVREYDLFDMVIASDGAGKTLDLIQNFIDLGRYEAVWILDDAAHTVWCMDLIRRMLYPPKFIFIQPEAFRPWIGVSDEDINAALIRRILKRDHFFIGLHQFLSFYVIDGVSQCQDMYHNVLRSYTFGEERASSQPQWWWKWNTTYQDRRLSVALFSSV